MSARIHWPRASQSGLMHCTVKPGKYCIESPSKVTKLRPIHARPDRDRAKKTGAPLVGQIPRHALPRLRTGQIPMKIQSSAGPRGNQATDGANSGARELWCQEKRLQDIVVRLRGSEGLHLGS